jgi:Leucine-rich repeat (LRR) protein
VKKYLLLIICVLALLSCGVEKEDKQVNTAFLTGAYISEFHELNLSKKNLTMIPNFEKYLTGSYKYDVWNINLQSNQIGIVNEDYFNYFPNLKRINLSYNKIKKVKLSKLPIEKLYIHKNEIKKADLGALTRLTDINLWYNKLKKWKYALLPNTIKILELQHNELEDIKWVEKLKDLESIRVEFNKLEDLDMVVLKDLKNMRFISAGENKLSKKLIDGFMNFNKVKSEE